MNYTCRIVEPDQFRSLLERKQMVFEKTRHHWCYVAQGFYYFTIENISEISRPHLFFVVFDNFGNIAGLMKLVKRYEEEDVWMVAWIDVHQKHKRKGIAKLIYQTLNHWVQPHMTIIGSELSAEGKRAKLDDLRLKLIQNCACFRNEKHFLGHEPLPMKKKFLSPWGWKAWKKTTSTH